MLHIGSKKAVSFWILAMELRSAARNVLQTRVRMDSLSFTTIPLLSSRGFYSFLLGGRSRICLAKLVP